MVLYFITMSIYKRKEDTWTSIPNSILQTGTLSMKSIGLLVYLFSLPDDWDVYQQEVKNHFSDGISAVRAAFSELENRGYIQKVVERSGNKIHKVSWAISSVPYDFSFLQPSAPELEKLKLENLKQEKLKQGKLKQGNLTLVRTNSTNKLNKQSKLKGQKTKKSATLTNDAVEAPQKNLPLDRGGALSVDRSEGLFRGVSAAERRGQVNYLEDAELVGEINSGGVYTINYNDRMLGTVTASTTSVFDDLVFRVDNVREGVDNATLWLYDALTVPVGVASYWESTDRDLALIEGLAATGVTTEALVDKLLDNLYSMLSGKKVMRFGGLFVGVSSMMENKVIGA